MQELVIGLVGLPTNLPVLESVLEMVAGSRNRMHWAKSGQVPTLTNFAEYLALGVSNAATSGDHARNRPAIHHMPQ